MFHLFDWNNHFIHHHITHISYLLSPPDNDTSSLSLDIDVDIDVIAVFVVVLYDVDVDNNIEPDVVDVVPYCCTSSNNLFVDNIDDFDDVFELVLILDGFGDCTIVAVVVVHDSDEVDIVNDTIFVLFDDDVWWWL